MSGLSEAELHVQAMRLVCEALQDREQDGLEVDWDVIRQMHDQMDAMLQALQHKHRYDSSEIVDLRKDRDHWKQARDTAIEGGELLLKSNQTLQAEIERLLAFVNLSRRLLGVNMSYADVDRLRSALAELDAGTEPTAVAEPATCPECERLQAFVGRVRELLAIPLAQISYDDMSVVRAELAALDDEPTPVAEPLDAEGGA